MYLRERINALIDVDFAILTLGLIESWVDSESGLYLNAAPTPDSMERFPSRFRFQIEALGRPGDVAIGISTSGKSVNVLRGLRRARNAGLKAVGLTGGTGGDMSTICDSMITVPSTVTARIQEMHITIGHVLCVALEARLGLV
jgi:hypothetical protein